MDELILAELKAINEKMASMDAKVSKLNSIEKSVKTMQHDITDIKKYLSLGIEEDLRRVRDRLQPLKKRLCNTLGLSGR